MKGHENKIKKIPQSQIMGKKWCERKKMHAMRGSKDLYSRILGGSEKGSEGQTQFHVSFLSEADEMHTRK
jgi:hypothetical protein